MGALCALLWSFAPSAAPAPAEQPFERVFARFNTAVPPPYRALRRMEAGIENSDTQGTMDAWTEYHPTRGLRIEVVRESGSEYIRNKILRKLLINEQELLRNGHPLRASIDERNYVFEDGGTTDGGLQRVMLKAARKGEGIINGMLFVSPDNQIVRMQGRLVKSPSFWVRDVDVTWRYARIGEHTLPTEMTSTGRVRLYGRSYFKMSYDYASIEGRPTDAIKTALR